MIRREDICCFLGGSYLPIDAFEKRLSVVSLLIPQNDCLPNFLERDTEQKLYIAVYTIVDLIPPHPQVISIRERNYMQCQTP